MNEILALSAVAQSKLIRDGEITSEELVRWHLDRIAEINPSLNAVVEVIPVTTPCSFVFSVKDSIEIKGHTCTAGTLGYRNRTPAAEDAALVARLRAAGGAPIARTNLPDLLFAFESDNLIFGGTNNPHDLTRTPGGSSGGEAALIAACGSPFGLGSDAAGSVRLPAHFSGITALKPTSGRLPREGHVPPASGWVEQVWQIGPMARYVEDLMWFMETETADAEKLRMAFFVDNGIMRPDADTERVVREAAAALGAVECRPPGIERSYDLEMAFLAPDGGDGVRDFLRSIGSNRTHPLLDGWLAKHEKYRTDLAGFAQIWHELDDFRGQMRPFLRDFDVILSPVAAFPAVAHGTSIQDDVFPGFSYTMTHNLTGWPAGVVRCGQTAEGLPIGVQIAAAPWREDIVLTVARILEERFGGWVMPGCAGEGQAASRQSRPSSK
jgi:amidase